MSGPPLSAPRPPPATSKLIPQPPSDPTASTSSSSSSFAPRASTLSRKKPLNLSIQQSIRPAPQPPTTKDPLSNPFTSEADKLRQDIERLQLSSHASTGDSPVSPTTPGQLGVQSDASSGSGRKKSTSGNGEVRKKKATKDKDGLDLVKDEDLEVLADLGAGNGGTATKVWNKKRGSVMARKLILVDAKPTVRRQILRELQIMNDCNSPYIVGYYGCFPVDVHVGVVMEYMDSGSLDYIYRNHGPVPIDIVGKVAEAVLKGLVYLYDTHRIIHRDIKPSNILANSAGEIKICDFGVSGELINSIANTFVGTSTYMSPERIQGAPYTIKSDLWSLGISLIELAQGRFPFSDSPDSSSETEPEEYDPDPTLPLSTQRPKIKSKKEGTNGTSKKPKGVSLGGGGHTMSILDLLQHIVNEPAPTLSGGKRRFSKEAVVFVEKCLEKVPEVRGSPQDLLASGWITGSKVTTDDLRAWAVSVTTSDE